MGWFGGASDTNASSNSNTNFSGTSTTTQNVPAWLQPYIQGGINTTGAATQPFTNPGAASGSYDFSNLSGMNAANNALNNSFLNSIPGYSSQIQNMVGGVIPQLSGTSTMTPNYAAAVGQNVSGVQGAYYDPATANAAQAGGPTMVNAPTGSNFMAAYQNPFQSQVVNSTLANYDQQAANQLAGNQAARGAGSAFNDRSGVADQTFNAQTQLNRAQLQAQLESQGFTTAAGLGQTDAAQNLAGQVANQGAGLQTNLFNAGNQQQTNLANMAALNAGGQYNASNSLTGQLYNAQANNSANAANAAAGNAANMFNAGAANTAGQFNAGQTNNTNLANLQAWLSQNGLNLNALSGLNSTAVAGANAGTNAANTFNTAGQNSVGNLFSALQAMNMPLDQILSILTGSTTAGSGQSSTSGNTNTAKVSIL